MEKKFNNEVVQSHYQKFIKNVVVDAHSAYLTWINTLELFDDYVDHVKNILDEKSRHELPFNT